MFALQKRAWSMFFELSFIEEGGGAWKRGPEGQLRP